MWWLSESFLPISFAMPLKRPMEVCFSGFVFWQTDLCKIRTGRSGLLYCCWRSEGVLQHGPWLMGRAAPQASWVPSWICRDTLWKKTISMLHVWRREQKKALMLLAILLIINQLNGAILFQYPDVLIRVMQLISRKLPKHRTCGVFLF